MRFRHSEADKGPSGACYGDVMEKRIDYLAAGLSPAIQRTLSFDSFRTGAVNRSREFRVDASGKCINVCRVLQQSGAEAACITVAGTDNYEEFTALCRRDGLNVEAVRTGGRTRFCTTLLDESSAGFTEIVAPEPTVIRAEEEAAFRERFNAVLPLVDRALIISGSRLAGFSDGIIPDMLRAAKERGLIVVADYRGADLKNSFISGRLRPDCVKINEEEFRETFGGSQSLDADLRRVSEQYGCAVVISRGEQSTLAADGGRLSEIESERLQPVNPIGCGDSMTAGIARGLAEGMSLEAAVRTGRDWASKNVMNIKPGWILPG